MFTYTYNSCFSNICEQKLIEVFREEFMTVGSKKSTGSKMPMSKTTVEKKLGFEIPCLRLVIQHSKWDPTQESYITFYVKLLYSLLFEQNLLAMRLYQYMSHKEFYILTICNGKFQRFHFIRGKSIRAITRDSTIFKKATVHCSRVI